MTQTDRDVTADAGAVTEARCHHLDLVQDVVPGAEGCEECLAAGDSWVHLRLCLICGHVGCCNESPNRHAKRHFEETGHPVMRSFEPGEDWLWCYVDDILVSGWTARRADDVTSKAFLRRMELFSGLSDGDLDRLYDMAKPMLVRAGDVIIRQGDPGDAMYVILEGQLDVVKRSGGQDVSLGVREPGEVVGEMALLENVPRSANVRAITDSMLLALSKTAFEAFLGWSASGTLAILRTMTSRLRSQESLLVQQEKMASLGTLAAGLAHELNNPAAAIRRSVVHLGDSLTDWERVAGRLTQLGLDAGRMQLISTVETEVEERAGGRLDALARSEREDEVQDWLEDHGVDAPWEVAPVLVMGGWDEAALDRLAAELPDDVVPGVVQWIASRASTHQLLDEVRMSAETISQIVGSVKMYSHLDQAPVQEIDVREGLEATLVMLRHELKAGVEVRREYTDVPKIEAYASELNQVWTNLIHNAVDAMEGTGKLTLRVYPKNNNQCVIVEIEDDGPGIPAESQSRIFDAFYTTKPPGVGSGLGLHIVYNIIHNRHHGHVRVESEPGRTCFEVQLPARLKRS